MEPNDKTRSTCLERIRVTRFPFLRNFLIWSNENDFSPTEFIVDLQKETKLRRKQYFLITDKVFKNVLWNVEYHSLFERHVMIYLCNTFIYLYHHHN